LLLRLSAVLVLAVMVLVISPPTKITAVVAAVAVLNP
jgi:hypothetical protein